MRDGVNAVESSLAKNVHYFIEIVWRRRFFILVPLLVSIPLIVIGSAYLPVRYTARTLLFFENAISDPLRLERVRYQYQRRAPSLHDEINALLKSGFIIDSALKQIMGEEYPKTATQQALARQRLRASLSVIQIGSGFYEIRLRASDPQELGEKLEVVTSRFLESLLMGGRAPATSVQLVLKRRKFEMQQAEKAVKEFERDIAGEQAGRNMLTKASQLEKTAQRVEAKKQELTTVNLAIDKALSETGDGLPDRRARGREIVAEPIRDRSPTSLVEKMRELIKTLLLVRSAAGVTEPSEVAAAKKPLAESSKIAGLKAKRDRLQGEVDRLAADVQGIEAFLAEQEGAIDLAKRLNRQLQETTAAYQSYVKWQPNSSTASRRPLKLGGSPGNIKVIDPPRDPKFADVSRMMYVMAGIFAGLVLGCSAAIVAEMFDQRLRRPEEFVAILGAPVICRLPTSQGIDDPLSLEIESAQKRHKVTPIRQGDRR